MKETDIRPDHLHRRYLELSAQDAERCFAEFERVSICCVACGSHEATFEFEKFGFSYSICRRCGTLFQSPRPPLVAFEAFYRDSVSSRFWAEQFFPAVAEVRRSSIFVPRVERLATLCAQKGLGIERLIDVGAGYGTFLEEWRARFPGTDLLAVEPSQNLAQVCRQKSLPVIEDIAENVLPSDGRADLVVCFEVLEHAYDPVNLIRQLASLTKPGGHVFVSTLSVDGFDIQTLWKNSRSIFPPHHINFLSIKGLYAAFKRAGLTDVDVSTPGKLDVDIVANAYGADSTVLDGNRFAKLIIGNEQCSAAFQVFLSHNCLSSHAWILGRSPL